MVGFMDITRKEFESGNMISLDELYERIPKQIDSDLGEYDLKHRIRSAVYALKKSGEIIHVGKSRYIKPSSNK